MSDFSVERLIGRALWQGAGCERLREERIYLPRQTVRCIGARSFTTQLARDAACLLDVDLCVISWRCGARLEHGSETFLADLEVERTQGVELLAVVGDDLDPPPQWAFAAAVDSDRPLRVLSPEDIRGDRLESAREILRYADWRVSLHDRIRLLAALDEEGSLSLGECLSVFRDAINPIAAVAALTLHRWVDLDLDSGRLSPQTRVVRHRD